LFVLDFRPRRRRDRVTASTKIGRQAIVVGAGIGGLSAAAALTPFFERVLVLERDRLPEDASHRPGTPQSRHPHGLLIGGQRALGELMPEFERQLLAQGAVRVRSNLDIRMERPGYDPFPRRDLGLTSLTISRPAIELAVRNCLAAEPAVLVRDGCRVLSFVASPDQTAVAGVRIESDGGLQETLSADLMIDASGRGALTVAFLAEAGFPCPEETTIGVDLGYSTGIFEIPSDATADWKVVFTFGDAPSSSRGVLLQSIERNRWMVGLGGRHDQAPPGDLDGFLDFARNLRTRTVFEAIRHARLEGSIARYGFRDNVLRHYERLARFPKGLLPIADAICRFNPVYGQGMTVAAQEACLLKRLLAERAGSANPLSDLATAFFAQIPGLVETPWSVATFDFIFPSTRGQRPADFDFRLRFAGALTRLASEDGAVQKLNAEITHLIRPRSAYRESGVTARVMAMIT
jgi:2-polyprenyl-6-methoxyphenol hydroxylase-like FAD-dependent oxidoreductase